MFFFYKCVFFIKLKVFISDMCEVYLVNENIADFPQLEGVCLALLLALFR
jgi:hypothetical protein